MSNSEPTDAEQRPEHLFKPGQSGNPAGRPKGSRNKLGEAFVEKLLLDFETEGAAAIVKCRTEKPDAYLKVIASILPKELKISNESDLSDEEILKQLRQLDALIRPFLGAEAATGLGEGDESPAVTH